MVRNISTAPTRGICTPSFSMLTLNIRRTPSPSSFSNSSMASRNCLSVCPICTVQLLATVKPAFLNHPITVDRIASSLSMLAQKTMTRFICGSRCRLRIVGIPMDFSHPKRALLSLYNRFRFSSSVSFLELLMRSSASTTILWKLKRPVTNVGIGNIERLQASPMDIWLATL